MLNNEALKLLEYFIPTKKYRDMQFEKKNL
jgi:hypothetical protein